MRISLCDQSFEAAETADADAETLGQALKFTPANAWVSVELGNLRYDQKDIAGALAHYSAALAVEDYADAWANRAEAWWEFRMEQNCVYDADQALRIDPRYAYANEIKGRCLIDMDRSEGKLDKADHLTRDLRQNPEGRPMEAVYFDTLAQIDMTLDRLDDVYANYSSALEVDPDLSNIYDRKLSELGLLPLSNAPAGVLTALRIDVKKNACLVEG